MAKGTEQRELLQTQQGAAGDICALESIRQNHHESLFLKLKARGAGHQEAEDVLAEIWAACVPDKTGKSLLEKYQGRSALRSWLTAVAMNRFIDRRRSAVERTSEPLDNPDDLHTADAIADAREHADLSEPALVALLRQALARAFASLSTEAQVMLRLVHLNGLTQREVGRMWGWHESKVSRFLNTESASVRRHVAAHLAKHDPWLRLRWEDFVELCATCRAETWLGWRGVQA